MNCFYQRHLLRLLDFSPIEIHQLLKLAQSLKNAKKTDTEIQYLKGKSIALIFEKDSTRTRCAFDIAAFDQGAHTTYIGSNNSQIGRKESIGDTARVLSRMYHGIQYRGYDHKIVQSLSLFSNVPVWNGLSDTFHPTQILADLLTMQEYLPDKKFNEIKLVYIGDAHNNISNSLLEAAAILGLDLRLIAPKSCWPKNNLITECRIIAQQNNGKITLTEEIDIGIKDADFIYTDVWVSMGEPEHLWQERINLLRPYQVTISMLQASDNPNIKFLHCLPALHNNETMLGKKIAKKYNFYDGIEVTNEVFESSYSLVFSQAENRLHTIKAVMVATLNKHI